MNLLGLSVDGVLRIPSEPMKEALLKLMVKYVSLSWKTRFELLEHPSKKEWIVRIGETKLSLPGPLPIKEIWVEHVYEPQPLRGEVIVDCGAHVGEFTCKVAKKNQKVVAIEPARENLYYLRRNVEMNGLNNVITVQKAVGNRRKKDKLWLHHGTRAHNLFCPSKTFQWVEVDTLDHLLSELGVRPTFIKMDVEGAELEALGEGAKRTLKLPDLRLAVAAYHIRNGRPTWEILKPYLEKKGFRVQVSEGGILWGSRKREHP